MLWNVLIHLSLGPPPFRVKNEGTLAVTLLQIHLKLLWECVCVCARTLLPFRGSTLYAHLPCKSNCLQQWSPIRMGVGEVSLLEKILTGSNLGWRIILCPTCPLILWPQSPGLKVFAMNSFFISVASSYGSSVQDSLIKPTIAVTLCYKSYRERWKIFPKDWQGCDARGSDEIAKGAC